MKTRVLGASDLKQLVEAVGRNELMDKMIEVLQVSFSTHDPDLVDARPILATSSMWDTETGHLLAIADATLLTALRTGAASALATQLLTPERPIILGVVGLGAQAVTQVQAISRVRKIERVIGFDCAPAASTTFAERVAFTGLPVEVIRGDALRSMAERSDVLCTCTSVDLGAGPVLGPFTPKPGLHVNAVGADFPGKLELPKALTDKARVFPDLLAQCLAEGECQQVERDRIAPELFHVAQKPEAFRSARDELTVFDSTGWAVEDDAALRLVLQLADKFDVGSAVQLESIPSDPYDPYDPYGEPR